MSVKSASIVDIAAADLNLNAYNISDGTLTINTSNCSHVGKHRLTIQVVSTGFALESEIYYLPTMEFEIDVEIKLCSLKNLGYLNRTDPAI